MKWINLNVVAKVLSWMPPSVIRSISNTLLSSILHYREKVILNNLSIMFPDLSPEEMKKIQSSYYKNLGRYLSEIISSLNLTKEEILQNLEFVNSQALQKNALDNRHTIILASHLGNWELVIPILASISQRKVIGVYQPISNTNIDDFVLKYRNRFGLELVPMKKIFKQFYTNQNAIFIFINDQSPALNGDGKWVPFFETQTLWHEGIERIGQKFDIQYINLSILPKNKKYKVSFTELNPSKDILAQYVSLLEKDIKAFPSFWLLSHNRWKNHKLK